MSDSCKSCHIAVKRNLKIETNVVVSECCMLPGITLNTLLCSYSVGR